MGFWEKPDFPQEPSQTDISEVINQMNTSAVFLRINALWLEDFTEVLWDKSNRSWALVYTRTGDVSWTTPGREDISTEELFLNHGPLYMSANPNIEGN